MNVANSTDKFYNTGGKGDVTYHTMYRASFGTGANKMSSSAGNNPQYQVKQRPSTCDRSM